MATTRGKAELFIKEMKALEDQLIAKYGFADEDVTVTINVKVLESVSYHSRQDED